MTRRRRAGNDPGERGRFSARRKTEAVLRLLRGEDVDSLSRELGVTAATLASWRDHFLAGGQTALKSRPSDAHDEEVLRLPAKVGELMMGNELLEQRAKRAEGDLGPFVAAEVEALGRSSSASAGRAYGVERVCRYLGIPRSSLYSRLTRESAPRRQWPKSVPQELQRRRAHRLHPPGDRHLAHHLRRRRPLQQRVHRAARLATGNPL